MKKKKDIIVKEEMKSECSKICRTNLLDYVLLVEIKRVFSSVNHSYIGLFLGNFFSRQSSTVEIQTDESSRKKINQLWLEIRCYDCIRIRDKLKDVINSLLSQFDRLSWATLMFLELGKSNYKVCRLFFARIFANDWSKHLILVSEFTCDLEAKYEDSTNSSNNKSTSSNLLLQPIDEHLNRSITLNINNGLDGKKECQNAFINICKEANSLKRKRGKEEKKVSLEDINFYSSRSFTLTQAAECLKVSRSTLKRKCRQLGISQWQQSNGRKRFRRTLQSKKVSKFSSTIMEVTSPKSHSSVIDQDVNQNIRTPGTGKMVPEFASQSEAESLNSISLRPDDESEYRSVYGTPNCKTMPGVFPRTDDASLNSIASTKDSIQYKTSCGTPKSNKVADDFNSSAKCMDQHLTERRSLILFPITYSHAWSGMTSLQLDTNNISRNKTTDERMVESNVKSSVTSFSLGQSSRDSSSLLVRQVGEQDGIKSLIKATYKDDMVRFHFSFKENIMGLKKEVARRFNLKLGTFKMKYLDDEDEWTLLASDLDWQEFVYIARSSRKNAVRLLVQHMRIEEDDKDDFHATLLKL